MSIISLLIIVFPFFFQIFLDLSHVCISQFFSILAALFSSSSAWYVYAYVQLGKIYEHMKSCIFHIGKAYRLYEYANDILEYPIWKMKIYIFHIYKVFLFNNFLLTKILSIRIPVPTSQPLASIGIGFKKYIIIFIYNIYISRESARFRMDTPSLTTALCIWSTSTGAQIFDNSL